MTEQCGSNIHEQEGSCKCGCGCDPHAHHHHHGEEGGCNCAEKFLELADEAWKEVLKEKIKAKILTHKGEHMEKLAELIATANGEKWKLMISAKTKCTNFKDNLKEFFTSCDVSVR